MDARAVILKKFRKPGDPHLLGIEDYFVAAEFPDAQQRRWTVEIREPSRQWHWLREGVIELFAAGVGAMFVLFGLFFLIAGLAGEGSASGSVSIPPPPPTKFDKTGFERTSMAISPQHDRVAVLDEKETTCEFAT